MLHILGKQDVPWQRGMKRTYLEPGVTLIRVLSAKQVRSVSLRFTTRRKGKRKGGQNLAAGVTNLVGEKGQEEATSQNDHHQ